MRYTVKYNSQDFGINSIVLDPNSSVKKRNLKNELYGVFYFAKRSSCGNLKLVSFLPRQLHLRNTSILNDDFQEYVNLTYSNEMDDFDIIYDVISNVLNNYVERENLSILIG